jgi:hypothetical protein
VIQTVNDHPSPSVCHRPANQHPPPTDVHIAFLIIGLVCLVGINILFIFDIEKTLQHNGGIESKEEREWGFGQVLALLLLVLPLRDTWNAFLDIQRNLKGVQQQFEDLFLHEIHAEPTVHLLQKLINQEADPNKEIKVGDCMGFLQLAAYHGKQELVEFLLKNAFSKTANLVYISHQ